MIQFKLRNWSLINKSLSFSFSFFHSFCFSYLSIYHRDCIFLFLFLFLLLRLFLSLLSVYLSIYLSISLCSFVSSSHSLTSSIIFSSSQHLTLVASATIPHLLDLLSSSLFIYLLKTLSIRSLLLSLSYVRSLTKQLNLVLHKWRSCMTYLNYHILVSEFLYPSDHC